MNEQLEIWFPNYKNNPGIVSKELIQFIKRETKHFDVEVGQGKYHNYEKFIVDIKFNNLDYKSYVKELIYTKLGSFTKPEKLSVSDSIIGRTYSPGKVGFGVFVDIGIRNQENQTDALLPLYKLRENLEFEELSVKEIVKILGLIDGYPLNVEVETIEYDKKFKIDLSLSELFIQRILNWAEDNKERLIFTKSLKSKIELEIKKLKLSPFIESIESIDPLTTVITCKKRTNASGLIPKLGARLPKVPIGIFHP